MARVLVVDDEKLIVKGIRFSLEQDGMEVDCAYDGNEAIEKAKEREYDVVLLDVADQVDMKRALEICQSLRQNSQTTKILLLVRPEQAAVRAQAVDAKNAGQVDNFVFYDSSLSYLLAKLAAL